MDEIETMILGKFPRYRLHQRRPDGLDRWGDERSVYRYSEDEYRTEDDANLALRLQTVRWTLWDY